MCLSNGISCLAETFMFNGCVGGSVDDKRPVNARPDPCTTVYTAMHPGAIPFDAWLCMCPCALHMTPLYPPNPKLYQHGLQ